MSTYKKYFKSFEFIKQADNAKSLSFYNTSRDGIFSKEIYDEFESILENTKEERFRISLHTSSEEELHNMIIAMKKASRMVPHKHEKSESYHIIKGTILLIYFDQEGNMLKGIKMNQDNTLVARVDKGSYHGIVALTDAIYHETRLGPFIPETDSIFPSFTEDKMKAFNEV